MARSDSTPRTTPVAPTEPPRYRLRGSFDDLTVSFLIPRTDSLIGSGRGCDLELPVRGISRRHATLSWEGRALLVTDLASKNGTFVNQARAQSTVVQAGDRLRFGPVTLELESIEREDAVVAMALRSIGPPLGSDLTAPWFEAAGGPPLDPWELAQRLLDCLFDHEPPDLNGALRQVGSRAGADAGLLAEWPRAGEALALSSFGAFDIGVLESEAPRFLGPTASSGARLTTDPHIVCWSLTNGFGNTYVLALRLSATGGDEPRALGDVLLRLVARVCSRPMPRLQIARETPLILGPGLVRTGSPAMQAVYRQIGQLRQTLFPVLLLGETGAGKEHLVRLLHDSSPHAQGPFVAINCAAIPSELLEAELFGIGRGIATGVSERAGKLREASGGTLFLDEVGEMPLALQAKLLRALESGTVEPVGAAPVKVEVRFVAATNADLGARIAAGQFRADLYYRLGGYQLSVPPLRERREDIAPLLEHLITRACQQTGKRIGGITLKALRLMQQYPWPGNIRQLDNEVRRLVVQCPRGQAIDSTLLPEEIRRAPPKEKAERLGSGLDLEREVAALEKSLIVEALGQTRGSRAAAAKLLGLSRNGLAAKMERLGIDLGPRVETPPRSDG